MRERTKCYVQALYLSAGFGDFGDGQSMRWGSGVNLDRKGFVGWGGLGRECDWAYRDQLGLRIMANELIMKEVE